MNAPTESEATPEPHLRDLGSVLRPGFLAVPRRPIGLEAPPLPSILASAAAADAPIDDNRALGTFYAGLAYFAQASVHDFDRIAAELAADEAPPQLHVRARACARAATNHGSLLGELATRHGVEVPAVFAPPPLVEDDLLRPLLERARENVVQGCVREGYGAVVAWHQALAADDSLVRKVFAILAHDGTAHVEFACELRAWFDARLTAEARGILMRAERAAIAELRSVVTVELLPVVEKVAGAPNRAAAEALLEQVAASIWSR